MKIYYKICKYNDFKFLFASSHFLINGSTLANITKYLMFGELKDDQYYTVQEGDTIESIREFDEDKNIIKRDVEEIFKRFIDLGIVLLKK